MQAHFQINKFIFPDWILKVCDSVSTICMNSIKLRYNYSGTRKLWSKTKERKVNTKILNFSLNVCTNHLNRIFKLKLRYLTRRFWQVEDFPHFPNLSTNQSIIWIYVLFFITLRNWKSQNSWWAMVAISLAGPLVELVNPFLSLVQIFPGKFKFLFKIKKRKVNFK